MRLTPILTLVLALIAGSATADRALLSGLPSDRDRLWRGAPAVPADSLAQAGFEVIDTSGDIAAVRDGLSRLLTGIGRNERVVIHLHGQFARSAGQTWYLGGSKQATDLVAVGAVGVNLAVVLEIAARVPGGAFVVLGAEPDSPEHGLGLRAGIGALEVPQGVTVLRGPGRDVAQLGARALYVPGTDLRAALAAEPDVTALGFLPREHALIPQTAVADAAVDPQEESFWQSVRQEDSETAYRDYLQRYPTGAFADEARAELQALLADPVRRAKGAEAALDLSRADRRMVQSDLTALGFNTRGIDGIFGNGTRSAIRGWQDRQGLPETGYLDAAQRALLAEQADALRAEQATQRAAAAALWQQIGGAEASPGDLRSYLDQFPEGENAATAQGILEIVEEARQVDAGRRDQADWIAARRADTPEAYRAYLEARPDGAYAAMARARLNIQSAPNAAEVAVARAEEAALQMGLVTRLLIERRLEQLGFRPGLPDGRFDTATREAIVRYQQARGLRPTGYISEATAQAMLSEAGISFTRP